jgi:phage tail sheath protein FI
LVELSYPGVYIVEVPPVARAITAASTSTAAFIGMTQKGPVPEKGPKRKPELVTSFTDFIDKFGSFTTKRDMGIENASNNDVYLPYAVWAFFQNGGRQCYIIRLAPDAEAATFTVPGDGGDAFTIEATSPGKAANELYVAVRRGTMHTEQRPTYKIEIKKDEGRTVLESWEVSMEANADDAIDTVINDNSEYIKISNPKYGSKPELNPVDEEAGGGDGGIATGGGGGGAALILEKPGYKLDEKKPGTSGRDLINTDIVEQLSSGTSALDNITDVSLIAAPGYTDYSVINAGFAYAERHRNGLGDAFFIADVPHQITDKNKVKEFVTKPDFQPNISGYGGLYFPWVKAVDRLAKGRDRRISLPPSGFVAGIYARTDNARGVWKAPAGTEAGISGGLGLEVALTDQEQGVINLAGVNALRFFAGYGSVVWGARTVSRDVAWRYVPVRRMANFLKSSIYDGIQWAVFEPNDEPLWDALKRNIGGFMMDLFRQRAFQGSTPEQAFFVKCDSETTTERDQQLGIVNILVGFAPLKPAEFIVVYLSQKVSQEEG